jgi:putative acetyltransferase
METESDHAAVRAVNEAAFESPAEADLVDALRQQARPVISLVAESGGEIVGHIMFSPISLDDDDEMVIMGLAPMAVSPANQREGIGSALVREGLARCRQIGSGAVVVLGHPQYYPRFGFVPASEFGIDSEYDVPDEVFMALEIQPGALDNIGGIARYHEAFGTI